MQDQIDLWFKQDFIYLSHYAGCQIGGGEPKAKPPGVSDWTAFFKVFQERLEWYYIF
jgi:hypothetical protein